MKRSIVEIDREKGIQQWTFPDERWYGRIAGVDGTTGKKAWDFVPSVSWVSGHYPKGREFYKWLATKGWSEAEEIKSLAGDKGSKVHQAVYRLVCGGSVAMSDSFENPRTLQSEELTPEEYFCVMTAAEWMELEKPEVLDAEYTVWSERFNYAGTVDLKCRLKSTGYKVIHIIDFKTSPSIWPSMEIQLSAYKHADASVPRSAKLAILQLGFKKNKVQKWKFTKIPDQFGLFLAARKIWLKESSNQTPFQRDYPLSIQLSNHEQLAVEAELRGRS